MTAATQSPVLLERRGRVGLITLNRPEKLNAMDTPTQHILQRTIEQCNTDNAIGAIVLTGAGRGFCSGWDMGGRSSAETETAPAAPVSNWKGEEGDLARVLTSSKPLIAAINGAAVGWGLTLTLACDVRLASDRARLSMRFIRVGLTPELGSTHFLPQIVGLGQALELVLTGRIIGAEEAGRIGLVNRVVPHDDLVDTAVALGEEIAFNPTTHVQWAKKLIYANAANDNFRSVITAEAEVFVQSVRSEAYFEAGRAFGEKREPNYHA